MFLVTAGPTVDKVIAGFRELLEPGDILIDGGNEWYLNSERRAKELEGTGIIYMGIGVSGGEYGARYGPSIMPGGPKGEARHIVTAALQRCRRPHRVARLCVEQQVVCFALCAEGWDALEPILTKVAAQTDTGACTTHLGTGAGTGNYVKVCPPALPPGR